MSEVQIKFDRKSSSEKIYSQILDLYQNELKGVTMVEVSKIELDYDASFDEYAKSAARLIKK